MANQYLWKDPDGVFRWHDTPAPRDGRATQARWPIHSDSAGINPDQTAEARAESVRIGVPTDFDDQGRAIFRTRRHRAKYLRAYGLHDKDGGYGDG